MSSVVRSGDELLVTPLVAPVARVPVPPHLLAASGEAVDEALHARRVDELRDMHALLADVAKVVDAPERRAAATLELEQTAAVEVEVGRVGADVEAHLWVLEGVVEEGS